MSRYLLCLGHSGLLAMVVLAGGLRATPCRAYEPIELKYLSEDAVLAVLLEPRRLLTSPEFEQLPVEVLQAYALVNQGIDPLVIEQILIFAEAPSRPGEIGAAAMVLRLTGPNPSGFLFESIPHLNEVDEIEGRPVYFVRGAIDFYVHMPDDLTLIVAFEELWEGMLERSDPPETRLAELLAQAGTEHDVLTVVSIEPVREMMQEAMEQEFGALPTELEGLSRTFELLDGATLRLNLTDGKPSSLELVAVDAEAATEFLPVLEEALPFLRETGMRELAEAFDLPSEQMHIRDASVDYFDRLTSMVVDSLAPVREDDRITMTYTPGEGPPGSGLATLGTLALMFMPRSVEAEQPRSVEEFRE